MSTSASLQSRTNKQLMSDQICINKAKQVWTSKVERHEKDDRQEATGDPS